MALCDLRNILLVQTFFFICTQILDAFFVVKFLLKTNSFTQFCSKFVIVLIFVLFFF